MENPLEGDHELFLPLLLMVLEILLPLLQQVLQTQNDVPKSLKSIIYSVATLSVRPYSFGTCLIELE